MANSTTLQIPNNLDDVVVLRRVLTDIVASIDELVGARGDGKAATESQLNTTANSIGDLANDVNSLDNKFVHREGDTNISGALAYTSSIALSGNSLVTASFVEAKGYLIASPTSAPSKLNGNSDTAVMSAKIDELIDKLIDVGVFS